MVVAMFGMKVVCVLIVEHIFFVAVHAFLAVMVKSVVTMVVVFFVANVW